MDQNVDMSVIREALQRRQQGGLGGGTSLPAAGQVSEGGTSALNAPQTPQSQPAAPATPNINQLPKQVPQGAGNNQQLRTGQQAQNPNFDPETRDLAKSLVQRLLKGL